MRIALSLWVMLGLVTPIGAAGLIWGGDGCVDCPAVAFRIGDRSLALDAAGHPHVVYAGDALYYAHFDGAAWQVEVVDAAPGIRDALTYQPSAAIALDSQGRPHISYLNEENTALRYAHKTAAGWQTQTLDTAAPGEKMAFESSHRRRSQRPPSHRL